jgi:hypothetical protein
VIFPDQAVRIVIATKSVDFRKGHDGFAAIADGHPVSRIDDLMPWALQKPSS